ncbi:MAG: 50S ribosomal protein L11 methyltransferase [Opitutaceae bacterium]|nr:50S ribosomal protein L11 methyltransferase [Opitutaceae bacterium]
MLVEARLEIDRAAAEAWSDALAAHGDERWSVYEDVDAQAARVSGYFADESAARAAWDALARSLPRALRVAASRPALRPVADEDWRESYKAHFKAWRHGRLHWVPEWERQTHRLPRGHVAVFLDPGMAFGTGNHETTRLCVKQLVAFAEKLPPHRRRSVAVIDAGCGSGILAISAAKLGFSTVFAFDNDAEAVAIARTNARRNGVGSIMRTATSDLATALKRRRADLVLANIQSNVLLSCAEDLIRAVKPGGRLMLSGILTSESASVAEGFRAKGAAGKIRVETMGEWAGVTWFAPR